MPGTRDGEEQADAKARAAEQAEEEARWRRRRIQKWMALVFGPIGLVCGYLLIAHLSGGALPSCGMPLGGERGELRRITHRFFEDLQFKDYSAASRYHAPEKQETVDIPYLVQRLFVQKPEMLDIQEWEILMVDIDSSGLRARVKNTVRVKHLADGEMRDQELMLYYKRTTKDAPWYMELEDSLRGDEAEKGKKH